MNAEIKNKKSLKEEEVLFLKELSNKLKNQNNYGTTKPIFFQIADYETKWNRDDINDFDEVQVILEDGDVLETDDEMKNYIINNLEQFDNTFFYETEETELKKEVKGYSLHELVDVYNENSFNIMFGHRERILKNAFLTEDAAKKHLKENSHHYSKDAKIYCSCAWRNPELEQLLNIIEKLEVEFLDG